MSMCVMWQIYGLLMTLITNVEQIFFLCDEIPSNFNADRRILCVTHISGKTNELAGRDTVQ